jgi:hypothetical protein
MFATLRHTTNIKLRQLHLRQRELDEFRKTVNDKAVADSREADKVLSLLHQMLEWGYKFTDENEVNALKAFLNQAAWDQSISKEKIKEWGALLSKKLQVQDNRYGLSEIFCKIVLEWIQHSFKSDAPDSQKSEEPQRQELFEQKEIWEHYAFNGATVNEQQITHYLLDLFSPIMSKNALDKEPLDMVRERISSYATNNLLQVHRHSIKEAVNCILTEDLFSGDKRKSLESLRENNIILDELADVIRSELERIEDWDWEDQPLALHIRRHINGKYRFYMDVEIIDAILIQLIGMAWAKEIRYCFQIIVNSDAWNSSTDIHLTKKDIRRRKRFLGTSTVKEEQNENIQKLRHLMYNQFYFLAQLPDSSTYASYDNDISDDDNGDDDGDEDDGDEGLDHKKKPNSTGFIKHLTLRLISTELLIQKHLHGECTYFQTDFKWFGPSIPHDTLWAVLKFFHFPEKWLRFFERFLKPEIVFADDTSDTKRRKRVRGIPMSHALSTTFGEILLFVLDFAINQATHGLNLYRFHDDIHFFGRQKSCIVAWETLCKFVNVMGLTLNDEKSASITCTRPGFVCPPSEKLPAGVVRWGFLHLSSGEWMVDQEIFKKNIDEMKFQLQSCQTIFAFVHAYNTYIKFFANNLGHIGWSLGQKHARLAMEYISIVQKSVFSDLSNGKHHDIVPYLSDRIKNEPYLRASSVELPSEFFYFPTTMGGLNVHNPFAKFLGRISLLWPNIDERVEGTIELERKSYDKAKEKFEAGLGPQDLDPDEPFMSYDEYAKAFEARGRHLARLYKTMTDEFEESPPRLSLNAKTLLNRYSRIHFGAPPPNLETWALEMFGSDAFDRFGDLNIGDKEYLPIGLVDLLLKERMRWQN